MRLIRTATLFVLVSTAVAAGAQTNQPGFNPGRPVLDSIAIDQIHFRELSKLRDEAVRRQNEDGGTLSANSKVELQAKLDRINANHARTVQLNDSRSLDANGVPIARSR